MWSLNYLALYLFGLDPRLNSSLRYLGSPTKVLYSPFVVNMPTFESNDGVSLHYETHGSSTSSPLILVHYNVCPTFPATN